MSKTENNEQSSEPEKGLENAAETKQEEIDYKAEAEKWKNLSRKNEQNAKANAEAAQLWQKHLDSQKTEDEKRAETEKQRASEIEALRTENAQLKAATKFGLTADDLQLLNGISADVFEERAAALAERLRATRAPSPAAGIGAETPPQGGSSTGDWLRDAIRNKK